MRSIFARSLVNSAVQQAVNKQSIGRRVLFPAAHLRSIASQVIDVRRLPALPWTQELQNAQGLFLWMEGYSHPNGGDVQ